MNDKDKQVLEQPEEPKDLIETEQKSQRILGRDEPGEFDHDVVTLGSFKSSGEGLNQLAGPLSLESWLEIPHRDEDPTAWGTNEQGRCFFDTGIKTFKFWDGTRFLGLIAGPASMFTEGAIPFGTVTGSLTEDATNLIWNDTLNVLEILAPNKNVYIGKGVIGAGNSLSSWGVFVGYEAGHDNYIGMHNTLVGYLAGHVMTESSYNTCVGARAGQYITTGDGNNTCIGKAAGPQGTGAYNVAVGANSGNYMTTGSKNTCLGWSADVTHTYALYRIAIGYNAQSFEDHLCVIGGLLTGTDMHLAIFGKREFRFYDAGLSPNYVGFEAPDLDADQIWVLPAADGNAGDVLSTDGAGNLSWVAP